MKYLNLLTRYMHTVERDMVIFLSVFFTDTSDNNYDITMEELNKMLWIKVLLLSSFSLLLHAFLFFFF